MSIYYKLVGYKHRGTYWDCTDFSNWVQGKVGMIPKPFSATSKGWREWKEANMKSHPTWYWITEEGFNAAQDIVYFPYDVYMNFYYWFRNAYITKPHVINTGLKKGQWYDTDTRMMAGLFNIVVEFVEVEKAIRNDSSRHHQDKSKLDNRRLSGLEYLDWEIGLGEESPFQSAAAKETKEIYLWIKDVRPNRPESHDVSGWSEYCSNKKDLFEDEEDEEKQLQVHKILDECHKIDEQYEKEDNDMLIRIVTNRGSMWT